MAPGENPVFFYVFFTFLYFFLFFLYKKLHGIVECTIFDIVKRLQLTLNFFIMNAFLITTQNGVSEFKYNFVDVQIEMNRLEKMGVVSNVKVAKFENSMLVKEFTYDYNGETWEKR